MFRERRIGIRLLPLLDAGLRPLLAFASVLAAAPARMRLAASRTLATARATLGGKAHNCSRRRRIAEGAERGSALASGIGATGMVGAEGSGGGAANGNSPVGTMLRGMPEAGPPASKL